MVHFKKKWPHNSEKNPFLKMKTKFQPNIPEKLRKMVYFGKQILKFQSHNPEKIRKIVHFLK